MFEKKGFTLIELLVVIAILAVLTTAVVLVLNPAELVRQARDSTRISDLAALNSATALFLADVLSGYTWTATSTCTNGTLVGGSSTSPIASTTGGVLGATACYVVSSQANTGTGWVNINYTLVTGGAPIANLPIDPVNDTTYYYAFKASSTTGIYEIDANMESTKYSVTTATNVESKDGGNKSDWYETGSSLVL